MQFSDVDVLAEIEMEQIAERVTRRGTSEGVTVERGGKCRVRRKVKRNTTWKSHSKFKGTE